jgi:23S rRNA (uracil1939-C5)-methyltransferase
VLELHAGDGNFTRDLVGPARPVIAVESDAAAVARLRRNVPAAVAVVEPVERAAARLANAGERFDLVVLDPPRTGAPDLAPLLARLAPRVVYISCDPMTLARDAAALRTIGLAPTRARGIDLMPQTFHVETVCCFER